MKTKNGDTVMIISDKGKGKTRNVIEILAKQSRAAVEGASIVTRHQKVDRRDVESGLTRKEAPIDVSNVICYDAKNEKDIRLGYRFEDGRKARFVESSNKIIK